ncbi:MAG: FG-GAP repeat protein [Planctomycetota bacterium]
MLRYLIPSGLLLGGLAVASASAQCLEKQKLVPANSAGDDRFGYAMAVDGDVAVIGAYEDDTAGGSDAGSAYVYRYNGTQWVEDQQLIPSNGLAGDRFGVSVAIHGDVIVVGAYQDDTSAGGEAGSAYVFRFNGAQWVEEDQLAASDGAADDEFGRSVAVFGDYIAVGAHLDNLTGANDAGSVYIYKYSGAILLWEEQQKLTASDFAASDGFGYAVALLDDTLLAVGAPNDNTGAGADTGSVYLFRRTATWGETQKLTASDAAASDHLGISLALDGDLLVAGAYTDDHGATDQGAAYVFRDNGTQYVEEKKLIAADAAASDDFGRSVSVLGNLILVGAELDDEVSNDCGSAYLFRYVGANCGWVQDIKKVASDRATSDHLGIAVAITAHGALAGAYLDNGIGSDSGSVYVFSTAELELDINPTVVSAGQTITIETGCGNPGESVMLVATNINGTPTFAILLIRKFEADYGWGLSVAVPPGFAGLTVTFQTFKQSDPCRGKSLPSNPVTVVFQ